MKLTQPSAQNEKTFRRQRDLILAATGDGIYGINTDGKTMFVNPAAAKMSGFADEEMLGLSQHELMHHTHPDGTPYPVHECPIYAAFRDGKVHRCSDEVFWRKDGTSFPVEYVSTPIWDEGKLVGAVVSFRDISERKAAETALEQSKQRERDLQSDLHHVSRLSAMGEVASAMAHELNQPLTAMMNYVQASRRLLDTEDQGAKDKAIGYMDRAIEQASRAGGIIRSLRKFVEKEDADRTFECINTIIEEAVALILPGGTDTSIRFETALAADLPHILVDKIRLQQVVVNLVRNALEALHGTKDASIEISTTLDSKDMIEVCVSDNGPGLSDALKGKLFQSFVSTKGEGKGMGVGLSICRTIVEEHEGKIFALDNTDGGVTFCFTLPTRPEQETQDA
ncbi:MAG: PAS domain-containing sensor histidine kinase [Robiginitomaculum sp.]|nr:MAG: PAS domain-containing sensor histidine kinase [Robiginitomaculum sp.]